ncbi:ribulose-phosphate 3-epimerase [Candidatus Omnitrophota bacterium]
MRQKIYIAPSLLAADFSNLSREVKKVEAAGADMIHIDVMDGHFVPNITIGPIVVKWLRSVTELPLDAHLMIADPFKYTDAFAKAGADIISVHVERVTKKEFIKQRKALEKQGVELALVINPETPLSKLKGFLDSVDMVLVMTVHPGFGGQKFMSSVMPKLKALRKIFPGDIQVDGGINGANAKTVVRNGGNILVAGTYIFESKDKRKAIKGLRNAR